MHHVVYVAPYLAGNTLTCLERMMAMPDVRLGVITHEPIERFPAKMRAALGGHYRVSDCLDPAALSEACRAFAGEWGRVDRLIGFLEQMQEALATARDAVGIPGMGSKAASNFRDKNQMKAVLRAAGLPVARQRLIRSGADALSFVEAVGYPIVLKPIAGMGSKNTMRASTPEELYAALNILLPSPERPIQGEEFITGSEHTFESVSIGGKVVWSSTSYYLPGPLKVLETPWMQYCVLLPRQTIPPHATNFDALNARALKALGMETGLSHMEWFIRPDGSPVISEVGARPPGVHLMPMMGLAHGVDMWDAWVKLMIRGEFSIPERKAAVGVAFFRAQGPGRVVKNVEGVEAAKAAVGKWVVNSRLPRVGQPRSEHYEGEGYAIVRHPTTEGAVHALRTMITTIKVRA
ncbi:MAG: biotin carboxylase [Myxococcota bacterium]|jgi:biotin carboxylase